ncbi:RNA exonuclease 1 homolog isoform X3 [Rana temporaria]|uniref:RNA exonuclease 1 homolog isoform X3 n=1 Tax=Rana temporaria TaxID=8407 RepID=UPI001AACDB85|nr:RNA exonuclease 1 homolog isoform X3 [Rana temporaria]
MLKSTGYFRAVECPFRKACRRPHCHFRHRGRGLVTCEGGQARNGAEYDPYSPELPPAPVGPDEDFSGAAHETCNDTLELERVNKAIEEVKSEVEREQRKYKELLEIKKEYIPSQKRSVKSVNSHLEYSPVGSGSSALSYNPTLLSHSAKPCKYTLDDCENETNKRRSMEYIPTAIPKRIVKKYVIDNSKPSTDMEYDPMSNYSARLLNKATRQKGTKSPRERQDEGCAPPAKKVRRQSSDLLLEATFSDSEDDSGSVLSLNKSILRTEIKDKSAQAVIDISVHSNIDDVKQLKKCKSKAHAKKDSLVDSKSKKKEFVPGPPMCADSDKSKTFSKELKKEKKSLSKKSEMATVKNRKLESDKKTRKASILSEKNARLNTDISAVKNREKSQSKAKKEKANLSFKESSHGAGDNGGKYKVKSESHEKSKELTERVLKTRTKQRTLSHVDLFGDESSEEEGRKKNINRNSRCEKGTNSKERITSSSRRSSTSSQDSSEIDYSILEKNLDLDSDPDLDPMEECLRVFNESQDVKTEDKGRKGKQLNEDDAEKSGHNFTSPPPGQKKRISHVNHSNHADLSSKHVVRPYRRPTPQEICYQRIQKAQEQAAQLMSQKAQEQAAQLMSQKAQEQVAQLMSQQKSSRLNSSVQKSPLSLPGDAKRIARVPSSQSSTTCQLLLPERKRTLSANSASTAALKMQTLTGMASKTSSTTVQKRQAHIPSLKSAALKRPVIPTEYGAKVPTSIRQRYLNIFIDECLKCCVSEKEAFDKALEEEKLVYSRSSSRNIYLNVAVNTLKKLRSQGPVNKATSQKVTNKKAISHKSILDGKLATKTSFTVQPSVHQEEDRTDVTLYKSMKNYILTPEQLNEHGYPLAHPEKPGKAVVFTTEEKKSPAASCRICCRCGVEYTVTQSGCSIRQEECVHHWGRLRRQRAPGGWETQYSCCSSGVGSPGCQVAKQHVQDGRKENLDGFVKTFDKLNDSESPGVYALDCEMCYTTKGLELTRVTVINSQLKVVYDTFVQPDNKIVDYNTRNQRKNLKMLSLPLKNSVSLVKLPQRGRGTNRYAGLASQNWSERRLLLLHPLTNPGRCFLLSGRNWKIHFNPSVPIWTSVRCRSQHLVLPPVPTLPQQEERSVSLRRRSKKS